MKISQESTCVTFFFNKVAGPQNCNFIKKRLQHRFFPMKFAKFLRTPCFIEHIQWLLLRVSVFQAATLLKKRLRQSCFSVNFAKFIRKFWQNTSGWLLLVFTGKFWKVSQNTSFIEHLWETAYFMYKLQNFNHQIQ